MSPPPPPPPSLSPPPSFNPIDITSDVDSVKRTLEEISLTLKSNFNMLLSQADQFNIQLDILTHDLMECSQKISFLFKINNNSDFLDQLGQLKSQTEDLYKQLQVFTHINTLKNLEKLQR